VRPSATASAAVLLALRTVQTEDGRADEADAATELAALAMRAARLCGAPSSVHPRTSAPAPAVPANVQRHQSVALRTDALAIVSEERSREVRSALGHTALADFFLSSCPRPNHGVDIGRI
jgi:hypothetical protein